MVAVQANFIPPAPVPRTRPPSMLEMMRIIYRNPLELWGEPSYNEPWISVTGVGGPLVIANDPGLIRHVLVDNARNYKLATVRQKVLRPILRDGLLTAEGAVWKRSRKAMAPVFTPRHIYRLRAADAGAQRRPSPTRYEGEDGIGRHRPRHDAADLRHPRRNAVLGRDRRRAGRLCRRDRPPVRDDGPRRSARHPARTRMAAALHPPSRPQDDGLLPQDRRRHGRTCASESWTATRTAVPEDFLTLLLRGRRAGRADARRDRGQYHHLHRRRPRDDGAGARLDALLPRRRRPGSATASRPRSTACVAAEPDPANGSTHAADPRGLRGGDAALPAGAFDQPRADRDRQLQGPDDRQGRAGPGHAVDDASPPQALGRAGRVHAGALPSREPRQASTATSTCPSAPARASASARASPCRRR